MPNEPQRSLVLSKETAMSVSLVISLLVAAFSTGIVYQKQMDMDRRLGRIEDKLDAAALFRPLGGVQKVAGPELPTVAVEVK